MNKRKAAAVLALIIILAGVSYVLAGRAIIQNKMEAYLKEKGYRYDEISNIEVYHSFINKIISNSEWHIYVKYENESSVIYSYSYENGEIKPDGAAEISNYKIFKYRDVQSVPFEQ